MGLRTPLYDTHVSGGAKIVDFGGWDMPLNYGSQIDEHHAVRRDAGMFDVSHMGIVDLHGVRCKEFLRHLLANDVGRLNVPGRALYSCMLLPDGGVIDDLIVYFLADGDYRIVQNAGRRTRDFAWIREHAAAFDVSVRERDDLAMIAIQGPNARSKAVQPLTPHQRDAALRLGVFHGTQLGSWFVARTGYTGEDGFEVILPAIEAAPTWNAWLEGAVRPAGLGARDTLRLEAGMNLYGNDMDESHHPFDSGLGWTVALKPEDRRFIGREALDAALAAAHTDIMQELVGLLLEERGVLRGHQQIFAQDDGETLGEVTSGTFSPTLNRSIALARIRRTSGERVRVDIRGKLHSAIVVKPPFVRNGKILIPTIDGVKQS